MDASRRPLQLDMKSADVWIELGDDYRDYKWYQDAVTAYQKAVHLDAHSAKAHYGMADAYLSLQNRDAALDEYKILKKLDIVLADKLFKQLYP